jgi:hypothetical protein
MFTLWLISIGVAIVLAFIGYSTGNRPLYYIPYGYLWIHGAIIKVIFWFIGAVLTGIVGGLVYHRLTFGPIFSMPPAHPPYQSGPAPSIHDEE